MDILTKFLHDLTISELAALLSRSERIEDLAARLSREANIERAQHVYEAALERAERIQRARQPANLGGGWSEVAISTVIVQPVFPRESLIAPPELRDKLSEFRLNGGTRFPAIVGEETIPDGLLFIEPSSFTRSQCQCQQLFSNGFLFDRHEAAWKNTQTDVTSLHLLHTAERMATVLAFARKYFPLLSHQGNLSCVVMLNNLQDCVVPPLDEDAQDALSVRRNPPKPCLLPAYRFEATLNAGALRDASILENFCVDLIEQVCWGLGTYAKPKTVQSILTRAGIRPSP